MEPTSYITPGPDFNAFSGTENVAPIPLQPISRRPVKRGVQPSHSTEMRFACQGPPGSSGQPRRLSFPEAGAQGVLLFKHGYLPLILRAAPLAPRRPDHC